jgi:YspA, cpYpsA-related SLOG family
MKPLPPPPWKTIIAGGRDYQSNADDYDRLDLPKDKISEVVSGGARGADTRGERWALSHKIPFRRFVPDWWGKGKAAGFLRNTEMAKYAEACVLFPGGRGTAQMYKEACHHGLRIYDWRSTGAEVITAKLEPMTGDRYLHPVLGEVKLMKQTGYDMWHSVTLDNRHYVLWPSKMVKIRPTPKGL